MGWWISGAVIRRLRTGIGRANMWFAGCVIIGRCVSGTAEASTFLVGVLEDCDARRSSKEGRLGSGMMEGCVGDSELKVDAFTGARVGVGPCNRNIELLVGVLSSSLRLRLPRGGFTSPY